MRSKKVCSLILGLAAMVVPVVVHAQATPPAEPAPPAAEPAAAPAGSTSAAASPGMPASMMRVGLNLVPSPIGTLKTNLGGTSTSTDAAFSFGLAAFFDYNVHPNFFVGVSPQYIFNVKAKDGGGDAAKEFDIQARLGGGAPVADNIQLYGYLAPGYGIIMPPSGDKPKGFMLGAHVGGMMNVAPTVFVAAQVGYQIGFEKVNSVDFKSNFLQIGLGGGLRL